MAKGILIDVGFTSDIKGYIEQLEKDFQKIDFGKTLGISEAFDKQIGDVRDKIAELKREIETIGKGHGIDVNFKSQFEDMNKSIKVLQESMKALMQTAPKNKQAELTNQLEQINQQMRDVAKVTQDTTKSINQFNNVQFTNKQQTKNIEKLYHDIERARQATEELERVKNKVGNTPYGNTDEVMNDIKAQMKLYSELAVEQEKLFNSKKKDKNTALTENTTKLATSITNTIQLINSLKAVAGSNPLSGFQFNKTTNIEELNTRLRTELDKVLQTVADQKAKLQAEFTDLGGEGLLSDMFKKGTRKIDDNTIPFSVIIDPKSKSKLLKECIELINKISEQLESTPIKVEVQLVSAYQSKRNASIIKELQKNIVNLEQNAREQIANGMSEAEATKFTQVSKDLSALIARMNKQIDNAMIFTVEVQTEKAISTINSFVKEVTTKLEEIVNGKPPKIKPELVLTQKEKTRFLKEVNSFIKEANKQITKINIEKSKLNETIFSSYVKQLTDAVKALQELQTVFTDKDIIKEVTEGNIDKSIQKFHDYKDTAVKSIAAIQLELLNTFNPEHNNLDLWANTLLTTLRTALVQIQEIGKYQFFQIDNNQTKEATTEMVKTAEESTADEQQSNSPSKVAEKLGEYWGEGYAKGILNTQTKVKNAIRALVDAGKITMLELANDRMAESDMVNSDIVSGKKNTAKKYTKAIQSLDDYKAMITSMGIKTPTDSKLKQSVLEVQKKNLEDIRAGAIDAQKAIDNLLKAFGGKFTNGNVKSQEEQIEALTAKHRELNQQLKAINEVNLDLINTQKQIYELNLKASQSGYKWDAISKQYLYDEQYAQQIGKPYNRYKLQKNVRQSSGLEEGIVDNVNYDVFRSYHEMEVLVQWRKNIDSLLAKLKSLQGQNLSVDELQTYQDQIMELYKTYNAYDANNLFTNKELERHPLQEADALLDTYMILNDKQEQAVKNDQAEVQVKQEVIKATDQQIAKEKELQQVQIQEYNTIEDKKNRINELNKALYDYGTAMREFDRQAGGDSNKYHQLQDEYMQQHHVNPSLIHEEIKQLETEIKTLQNLEQQAKATEKAKEELTNTESLKSENDKVAKALGQYFGDNYAEGILKGKNKVQNAIRALYNTGKISETDLALSTLKEADDAYQSIVSNEKSNRELRSYQRMIEASEKAAQAEVQRSEQVIQTQTQIENLKNDEERIISDIGLTYEQLIQKLRQENDEIEKGNKLFKERVVYLNNGVVVDSFQGGYKNVNEAITDKQYDKIVHTHPTHLRGSNNFSAGDIQRFYDNKMNMPSFVEAELFSGDSTKVVLEFSKLTNSFLLKFYKFYEGLQQAINVAFGQEIDHGKFEPDPTISNEIASAYFNTLAKSMINSLGGNLEFDVSNVTINNTLKEQIYKTTKDFQYFIEELYEQIKNGISEEAWNGIVRNNYHDKFQEYRYFYDKNQGILQSSTMKTETQAKQEVVKATEQQIVEEKELQQTTEQSDVVIQKITQSLQNNKMSIIDVVKQLQLLNEEYQKTYTYQENGLFYNNRTKEKGLIMGDRDAVDPNKELERITQKKFSTGLHFHPGPLGAFGEMDMNAFIQQQTYGIIYQYVVSSINALKLDISKVKPADFERIAKIYSETYVNEFSKLQNNATIGDLYNNSLDEFLDYYKRFIHFALRDIESPVHSNINNKKISNYFISATDTIDNYITNYIRENWENISQETFAFGHQDVQKQVANEIKSVMEQAPKNIDKEKVFNAYQRLLDMYEAVGFPEEFESMFNGALHRNPTFVKDFVNQMNTLLEGLLSSVGGSLTIYDHKGFYNDLNKSLTSNKTETKTQQAKQETINKTKEEIQTTQENIKTQEQVIDVYKRAEQALIDYYSSIGIYNRKQAEQMARYDVESIKYNENEDLVDVKKQLPFPFTSLEWPNSYKYIEVIYNAFKDLGYVIEKLQNQEDFQLIKPENVTGTIVSLEEVKKKFEEVQADLQRKKQEAMQSSEQANKQIAKSEEKPISKTKQLTQQFEDLSTLLSDAFAQQNLPLIEKYINDMRELNIQMSRSHIKGSVERHNKLDDFKGVLDKLKASQKQPTKAVTEKIVDKEEVKSQSKVAEMLGEYWGSEYAKGILKAKKDVKNAIRALLQEKLISVDDIKNDAQYSGILSDTIINRYNEGKKPSKDVAQYQKIIKAFMTYRSSVKDIKIPKESGQFRDSMLAVQKKNLEDIRSGAINAKTALKNLQTVYNANIELIKQQKTAIQQTQTAQESSVKADQKKATTVTQTQSVATKANEKIAKTEEKAVSKTQQMIEQFESLNVLLQNAFANKNLTLMEKYFAELNTLSGQMNKSHIKGADARRSILTGHQAFIEQVKAEVEANKKQTTSKKKTTSTKQPESKVVASVEKKSEAFKQEKAIVTDVVDAEVAKLKELESAVKSVSEAVRDKNSAFKSEKTSVNSAVNDEIKNINKINKEAQKEAQKQQEERQLKNATNYLTKNYEKIQTNFNNELQKDNRTLVNASFEPVKSGLIEITALIKEADETYKTFIYTTKNGTNFKIANTKQGFNIDKQGAQYEKYLEQQEKAKNALPNIGRVEPNTPAMQQVIALAKKFKIEWEDIDRVIRNVDHGIESFQFYKKNGDRTTLGINSENVLWEKEYIVQITQDINNFKKEMADLPKIVRSGITNYDANAGRQYIDALNHIAELWKRIGEYQQMGNVSDEEVSTLRKLFGGSSQTIMDTLSAKLPTDKKTPEMIQQIETLRNEFQSLFQSINDGNFNIDGLDSKIVELINRAKELYQNIGLAENRLANPAAISKLLANIGDELNRNTKMSGMFKMQLESLVKEIQSMGQEIPNDKFKDFAARFQNIRSQIHLAGQTGKSFFNQLSTSLGRSIIQFANMYLSLYRVVSYIRQGVNQVTQLDKALTTMSYTMNITNSQIKEMGNNIVAMAKDLKISVDNVSQIYQIYANMQTTTEEMMKTARPTAILTNLSGVDASTAADQIQGVLNQFNMLADESMHIVDVYDYISANIPVDYSKGIAGMADAVKNVGNVAAEAGLSFEQLGAIIGKVMAKTRQDGSSIGNALRTIMVRISKANKLAGDEVDNATVGNAAKALHKIGVEVYTTSGEFREFDVIMSELAQKWDDLSDAEQANISFQIAATRQTATLKAILDQWTGSMQLATEATEANGNALANQEKYEASIAGRTQALKNEMSEFWINTLNSDMLKKITSELTKFVGELNDANSVAGALVSTVGNLVNGFLQLANAMPSGSALGLLLGLTKGRNLFTQIDPKYGGFNLTLGPFAKTIWSNSVSSNDVKLFQEYSNMIKGTVIPTTEDAIVASDAWKNSMANASVQAQQMAINAVTGGQNINATLTAMRAKMIATTVAAKALNIALSIGLTVAVSALVKVLNNVLHAEENHRKEIAETIDKLREETDAYQDQAKEIDELVSKYNEYNQKVEDGLLVGEEFEQAQRDLYDVQRDLNDIFGTTANQLDLVNRGYEEQSKLIDNNIKKLREQYLAEKYSEYQTAQENMQPVGGWYSDFIKKMPGYMGGKNSNEETFQKLVKDSLNLDIADYAGAWDIAGYISAEEFRDVMDQAIADKITENPNILKEDKTFKTIYDTWFDQFINDPNSTLNSALKAREVVDAYDKILLLNNDQYAPLYKELETLVDNYKQAVNEQQYDMVIDLGNQIYEYIKKTGPFDAMPKQFGKFFSELFHEYANTSVQFGADENVVKQLLSLNEWFKGDTLFKNENAAGKDKYGTNNVLIDAYESAVSGLKDYISYSETGEVEINFGKIARVVDNDELFQTLGMDAFENYIEGFGENSDALGAYLNDAFSKTLHNMDTSTMTSNALALLSEALYGINAELFGVSENTLKLEQNYWELRDVQDKVAKGAYFTDEETKSLVGKYQDLAGAIEEISKTVDEETGEVKVTYKIQEDAIDNLVNKYGELSNEAITSMKNEGLYAAETIKWLREMEYEILQAQIDLINFNAATKLTPESLVNAYNTRDFRAISEAFKGADITQEDYERLMGVLPHVSERLQQLKEWEEFDYKVTDDDGTGKSKKDKKDKSQYDWLDSYLDKRNRALQKEQTLYDNLAKNDPIDLIKNKLKDYQKGGNVNLLLRPEIDTEELNKAGYDAGEGFATVFTSTYSNAAGDLAINFTPIIVDPKTGEYLGVMAPDEFDQYCYDVVDGVRKDDLNLQIGAAFTGKDAIEQAGEAAWNIHLLHEQISDDLSIEEKHYGQLNYSLNEQNKLLDDQISAYDTAEKEYGRRMKKGLLYDNLVEAFGKDKSKANEIVQKIINREDINLLEYTSDQSSAITAMTDNFNKKLDAADKKLEAQNTKRENNLKIFTNNIELITKQYDHALNEFAQRQAQLEHYQTMRTNSGMMENQKLYLAMLDNTSRELEANIQKRNELTATLDAMKPKTEAEIEEWWNTKDAIDATTQAIWESEEAIESYQKSMRQLSWDLNDRIRDITGNVRNETSFLIDTLGTFEKDMYSYTRDFLGNDAEKTKIYNGQMSDQGLATLALRRVNAKAYRENIERINKEVADAQEEYLKNTADVDALDRLNDLIDERNNLIQSYNDEREAILSLVKDGYDKQLQSLQAITDKYMEARQAEKDLYDYQKNIAKQTKNIANLRKQMQAYVGDMSEEARAKMQTLTVQLEEAEEGLADTQYERQLSDQQRIFDHLYQSLEDYFNDKLENPEKVLKSTEQLVNDNMPRIKDTLNNTLSFYKTNISKTLDNILGTNGIGKIASNIDTVDGDIKGIKNSVNSTGEDLKRYLEDNNLKKQKEETIYDRISKLYDEDNLFGKNFTKFNTKLDEINESIKQIDKDNKEEKKKTETVSETTETKSTTPTLKYQTTEINGKKYATGKREVNLSEAKKVLEGLGLKNFQEGLYRGHAYDAWLETHNIVIVDDKYKKRAKGSKRINANELAWTQENGLEAILRPTDNAILTPLKAGDSVLNAQATQTLWDFANNPLAFMKQNLGMTTVSKSAGVTFNNSMSPTIVVNGVSNANEFIRELQKNKQFESMIQDMTINQMNGGNPLAKMKYKF